MTTPPSSRSSTTYSIPELADDVAALCSVVGIERPVVVGHSLGGMIAVDLGAWYPSLASALVLVDPGPIDPLPSTVEFFREFAEELEGPNGEEVRRAYVHDMGARDDELARWIVELVCVPRQRVAAAVIRGVGEWNGRDLLARCTIPVLLLRAWLGPDYRRPPAARDQARPGGRDHRRRRALSPVRSAREVNAMIERFVTISL